MAGRLLLLLVVAAAASLLAASPVAAARPCHTLLISYSASANPSNDPDHRAPLTATVIAVFRVRRLGPHLLRAHGHAHPHPDHRHHHHLHSIPANVQIRRPELPELPHSAAGAASGIQERVKDILVVVVGILFGVGCGTLTAASMYLVWSVIAGPGACSHYSDEDDEVSDSESPKKVGYVIIPGVDVLDCDLMRNWDIVVVAVECLLKRVKDRGGWRQVTHIVNLRRDNMDNLPLPFMLSGHLGWPLHRQDFDFSSLS